MRSFNYIWLSLLVFCLFSCAEDKGNYDYKTLNNVEITGFKPATDNNGVYTLLIGQYLDIKPVVKQTQGEARDLAYLWMLDRDTIGKAAVINWQAPETMSFGEKAGRLVVTDQRTKISYYHNFTVVITNPFNQGYYVYARDEEDNAIISFLSSKTTDPEFVTTNSIGGMMLGKHPIFAACQFGYDENYNTTWHMYYAVREGQFDLIKTNTLTFTPTTTLTADSYIGGNPDGDKTFSPSAFYTGANQFFISDGQLVAYNEGILYRPAHLGDVRLASWLNTPASLQNQSLVVFDLVRHSFLYLQSQEDDPLNGIIGDSYTYDRVVDFEGSDLTSAQEMIVEGGADGRELLKVITRDGNNLNFYTFTFDISGADPDNKPVMVRDAQIPVNGLNENVQAVLYGKTWYILAGNTIYKSPILLPSLSKVKDIPENLGEVKSFNICANGDKIIVATYQPDSPAANKGSVYFLNSETGDILEPGYPNVTGEAITILNTDYEEF